jgi:hypothetical protein
MKRIRHVASKEKKTNAYRVWWGIPEGRSGVNCKENNYLPEVQLAFKDKVLRAELQRYNRFIDACGNAWL